MKRPVRISKKFYVYEHWRPDKDLPFWVGKGHANRAYWFRRNKYYDSIVAKLDRLGMCVEVRMVESGMPEREALALETVRIRYWRSRGIKLANMTDGGEGTSGYRHSRVNKKLISKAAKQQVHSEESKAKTSASLLGHPVSIAARNKTSKALLGRKLSKKTCKKMSRARKGKKLSISHCAAIGRAHAGKIISKPHRNILSEVNKGNKNASGKRTPEQIERIRLGTLAARVARELGYA